MTADDLTGVIVSTIVYRMGQDGVKQVFITKLKGGGWALPGGNAKIGESPQQAAARELAETSGIKATVLKFVAQRRANKERGRVEFIFATAVPPATDAVRNTGRWVDAVKPPRLVFGHNRVVANATAKFFGKKVVSEQARRIGMHERLAAASRAIDVWCGHKNLTYRVIADEDRLQGFLIPKTSPDHIRPLLDRLQDIAIEDDLHFRQTKTRSGTILAFSLEALSEDIMASLVPEIDRSRLARKLDIVLGNNVWNGRRLAVEDLAGIAAGHQPTDMLGRLRKSLGELGLLNALKAAQISNGLSPDKQILHFYINDADGRRREVMSIELSTLGDGNNMEQVLKDLADMARRRAPGTTEMEIQKLRNREQFVRNVAKKYTPQDQQQQPPPVPVEGLKIPENILD